MAIGSFSQFDGLGRFNGFSVGGITASANNSSVWFSVSSVNGNPAKIVHYTPQSKDIKDYTVPGASLVSEIVVTEHAGVLPAHSDLPLVPEIARTYVPNNQKYIGILPANLKSTPTLAISRAASPGLVSDRFEEASRSGAYCSASFSGLTNERASRLHFPAKVQSSLQKMKGRIWTPF
ncbi:hypothetical protein E9536_40910 [Burkholderia sp. LS-044]|uniref:hypothetical protein n=1 Tax=Burkholderia sp. LS-044 TaxID=1459967 RepID=UPI0010A64320|nr:hypothetical protein [Burkholderia sp. LS-044]THJ45641.1 hypothetical protein E9536_40910 [Burkholderia sp. LS-044]